MPVTRGVSVSTRRETSSGPAAAARASAAPVSKLTPTTGILVPGRARVPWTAFVLPGVPPFMTTTAAAPARSALCALSKRKQPPRWTRATSPSRSVPKSRPSQPLVEASVGSTCSPRSTGASGAVTAPLGEYCIVTTSGTGTAVPDVTSSSAGRTSRQASSGKRSSVRLEADSA